MENPTSDRTGDALLAPSDIADIAKVSRAAVSNWRKRAADFPPPAAGTPERPLFDRVQVLAWLRANDKDVVDDPAIRVWSVLNLTRDAGITHEAVSDLLLTIACARKLSDQARTISSPWQDIRKAVRVEGFGTLEHAGRIFGLPEWDALVVVTDDMRRIPPPAATALLDAFGSVDTDELAEVTDYALAKIAGIQIRKGVDQGFAGSRVSEILANLAGPEASGTVYDPACGIGQALLRTVAVKSTRGDSAYGEITRVVGHDIDSRALTAARQRAYLHDVDVELARTDVLREDLDPHLKADVIVLEPPFGLRFESGELADPRWRYGMPPRSSADMAWIQHAVSHLAEGGRAYVVTPMGTLSRSGQDSRIRAELISRGCVEAVFGLPGKLLPHISTPLAVWVLCPPGENANPDRVLLVDGSKVDNPESQIYSWLGAHPGTEDLPVAVVRTEDLLASNADLTPTRWLTAPQPEITEIVELYAHGLAEVNEALDVVTHLERPITGYTTDAPARVMNVGQLINQGVLEYRPGRIRRDDADDYIASRLIEARDVRDRNLPDPDERLNAANDAAGDDDGTAGVDLTRPGDVLVTTMHEVRTLVDMTGGHALGNGIFRLRALTDQLDPAYLAAALCGTWNARFQTGATIQKARVRDLEVPLIPLAEQAAYVNALDALADLENQAAALAQKVARVRNAMLEVLRYSADQDGRA